MFCVIMAGGKGTRFWPRSRASMPKQLLDITGARTMIQETVSRIAPLTGLHNIIIVTEKQHADALRSQVPGIPEENIVVEPCGRNTAPCICLAALIIRNRDPDDVMAVLPADHHIADPESFRRCLTAACEAARQTACLVTMGIRPTRPETGYGYMQLGQQAGSYGEQALYRVTAFHEKPSREKALEFLDHGSFLWNSGMFVWTVAAIMEAMERYVPDTYRILCGAVPHLGSADKATPLSDAYAAIRPVSVDCGIMEPAENVVAMKADFGWNDIGSWSALHDVLPRDNNGNAIRGNVIAVDSHNVLAHSPHKVTAVVGLDDIVIVDTEDALLVCAKDKAQDVKSVVEALEKKRAREL